LFGGLDRHHAAALKILPGLFSKPTPIGAYAQVNVSDILVLGAVAGGNGARATVQIGIGTSNLTNLLPLGKGAGPSLADG